MIDYDVSFIQSQLKLLSGIPKDDATRINNLLNLKTDLQLNEVKI